MGASNCEDDWASERKRLPDPRSPRKLGLGHQRLGGRHVPPRSPPALLSTRRCSTRTCHSGSSSSRAKATERARTPVTPGWARRSLTVRRGQQIARSTVRTVAALLPRPESQIMAEAWAADLNHADELDIDPWDIARGAILYVAIRGISTWWRRQWARVVLITMALVISAIIIPPWVLLPVIALASILWLIAAPTTRPGSSSDPT